MTAFAIMVGAFILGLAIENAILGAIFMFWALGIGEHLK